MTFHISQSDLFLILAFMYAYICYSQLPMHEHLTRNQFCRGQKHTKFHHDCASSETTMSTDSLIHAQVNIHLDNTFSTFVSWSIIQLLQRQGMTPGLPDASAHALSTTLELPSVRLAMPVSKVADSHWFYPTWLSYQWALELSNGTVIGYHLCRPTVWSDMSFEQKPKGTWLCYQTSNLICVSLFNSKNICQKPHLSGCLAVNRYWKPSIWQMS